jgi:hypothetical protein
MLLAGAYDFHPEIEQTTYHAPALTGAGLPEQLNFTLNFPQQSDGSRVHAVIHTNSANFDVT